MNHTLTEFNVVCYSLLEGESYTDRVYSGLYSLLEGESYTDRVYCGLYSLLEGESYTDRVYCGLYSLLEGESQPSTVSIDLLCSQPKMNKGRICFIY